ncbi:MafI family immunity protein [Mannheimia sp. E30BD]|uniref:MafI family immunity protein n=1 Tax=Mannheimia sp. E30BD TaxID=3278708 RepID=UPI00359EC23B
MRIQNRMNQLLRSIYGVLPIEDINNAEELIIYQEYGIALELICVQLYEYDKTIDVYTKNLIMELILDMGLNTGLIDGIKVYLE